jgi:hypothetical protein
MAAAAGSSRLALAQLALSGISYGINGAGGS